MDVTSAAGPMVRGFLSSGQVQRSQFELAMVEAGGMVEQAEHRRQVNGELPLIWRARRRR